MGSRASGPGDGDDRFEHALGDGGAAELAYGRGGLAADRRALLAEAIELGQVGVARDRDERRTIGAEDAPVQRERHAGLLTVLGPLLEDGDDLALLARRGVRGGEHRDRG